MSQRITAYIRQIFGEDVLAEIVSKKRTVSLNGVVLDATVKTFRDKRITPTSKVEVSIVETNNVPVVETTNVVTEQVTEVVTDEVKTKRHYARLKYGKSIPEGAIIHTSKSGKQYYLKVIGKEEYI